QVIQLLARLPRQLLGAFQLGGRWDRHDDPRRAGLPGDGDAARRVRRTVYPGAHAPAASRRVEGGKLVAAVAEHRDGKALEALRRQPQVEDDLRSRAENGDRRSRQLFEIRRLVLRMPAVAAPDPTRGPEPYARPRR